MKIEECKNRLKEINSSGWSGMKYDTYRNELRKLYKEIISLLGGKETEEDLSRFTNDYLNQNSRTVLKSLDEDNLSQEFLEELLKEEKKNKNRKTVLKKLKERLK